MNTRRLPMNPDPTPVGPSKRFSVVLWCAQIFLGVTFAGTGVWKMVTPRSVLGETFPWMAEVSAGLFYSTAVLDLLGGLGVVLPSLTGVKPELTRVAALGCAALQGAAAVFHILRGEASNTPFNFFLIAVSLLVFWGRRKERS